MEWLPPEWGVVWGVGVQQDSSSSQRNICASQRPLQKSKMLNSLLMEELIRPLQVKALKRVDVLQSSVRRTQAAQKVVQPQQLVPLVFHQQLLLVSEAFQWRSKKRPLGQR